MKRGKIHILSNEIKLSYVGGDIFLIPLKNIFTLLNINSSSKKTIS